MPLACLSSLKRSISLSSVTPHPPGFPSAPIAGLLHFQLLFPSLPLSKFWGSSRFLPSPLFFSLYLLPGLSPSFNYFTPHLSSWNLFSSSFPFSENHTDIHPSGQATHLQVGCYPTFSFPHPVHHQVYLVSRIYQLPHLRKPCSHS